MRDPDAPPGAPETCDHGVRLEDHCPRCVDEALEDDEPDVGIDVCEHGVGFDETCDACEDDVDRETVEFELEDDEDEEDPWP